MTEQRPRPLPSAITLAVALALPVSLALPPPVHAAWPCLLGCDSNLDQEAATSLMRRIVGDGPPAGVSVTHGVEGGFQDRFVQIRFSLAADRRDVLLAWLSVAGLPTRGPMPESGPVAWWAPAGVELDLWQVALDGFPHGRLGLAPDADRPGWLVAWLFAFQT